MAQLKDSHWLMRGVVREVTDVARSEGLRAVHACWDENCMARIDAALRVVWWREPCVST